MTYTPQTWTNNVATPLSAARLNYMEAGIEAAAAGAVAAGVGDYLSLSKSIGTLGSGFQSVDWSGASSTVVGTSLDISANVPRILEPGVYALTGILFWGNWPTEGTYRTIDVWDDDSPYDFSITGPPTTTTEPTRQIVSATAPFPAAAPNPIHFEYNSDGTPAAASSSATLIVVRLA